MDSLLWCLRALLFFVLLPALFTWFWVEVFNRLPAKMVTIALVIAVPVMIKLSSFVPDSRGGLALRDLVEFSSCILVIAAYFWSLLRGTRQEENECEL